MSNSEKELLNHRLLSAAQIPSSELSTTKTTKVDPNSDEFPKDVVHWMAMQQELEELDEESSLGGMSKHYRLLRYGLLVNCMEGPEGGANPEFSKETMIQWRIIDPLLKYVCSVIWEEHRSDVHQRESVPEKPDAVVEHKNNIVIVGEVKTPWAFNFHKIASSSDLVTYWQNGREVACLSNDEINVDKNTKHHYYLYQKMSKLVKDDRNTFQSKVYHCFVQHYRQLVANRSKYGFISTWDYWWFLKREGAILHVSDAYQCDANNATVLQMLGRLLKTAVQVEPTAIRPDELSVACSDDTSANNKSVSGGKRKLDGLPSESSASTMGMMKNSDTSTSSTTTLDHIFKIVNSPYMNLGFGASGWATRVFMKGGQDLVMKAVDVCQRPELFEELKEECAVYDVLRTLQGKVIPRLVCYPFWYVKGIMLSIVMTFVGKALTEEQVSELSQNVRKRAVEDLCRIHQLGVVHGDIRLPNLVWNEEKKRIMFIDFGRSKICDSSNERTHELFNLCELLLLKEEFKNEPNANKDCSSDDSDQENLQKNSPSSPLF